MKGTNTYAERMSVSTGEDLFEAWCKAQKFKVIRVGFNVMDDAIRKLNPFLRNIPDYLVTTPKGSRVVQVKGTYNFKEQEIKLVPTYIKHYESKQVPLYYAFCIRGQEPILKPANEVIKIYNESGKDNQWPDGKVYRTLAL